MNKKLLKLLNEFANSHSLAREIMVTISDNHKHFQPRNKDSYAKYEEANLLASIIVGAENFCYFLERNGYRIQKGKHGLR
jgi:hypothetical protein